MIHFVGAGPGSPDLITVRGKQYLEEADVIIYAGSLVNPQLLEYSKDVCTIHNSAKMTLEEVIAVMERAEAEGKMTVRLHTGDPCIYGAIREQMDILDEKGIAYDYCPGVSAFCGAASALNLEYTLPDISQSVIITRMEGRTPVPSKESIQSFAAHQATMVVFLSTGMLEELSRRLIEGGYREDTPAAIVYKATWPDEKKFVCTVGTLAKTAAENNITKTALMIIGDSVSAAHYDRSKLYDPGIYDRVQRSNKIRIKSKEKKMHISIICFSLTGYTTAEKIQKACSNVGIQRIFLKKSKYLEDSIAENTAVWTGHHFKTDDGLIFVGACGIAVRSIAPYVVSKKSDPAVLVVDECGKFVISLLSGHLGGANALALKTAEILGAEPVVTTATDLHDRFAVDVFAKNNHCAIFNMKAAKEYLRQYWQVNLSGFTVNFHGQGHFRED